MSKQTIEQRWEVVGVEREEIGRLMHESWTKTKREQGFHGPWDKCSQTFECCRLVFVEGEKRYMQSKACDKFHPDLIPWEELPEPQKDINRHAFDALLPLIEKAVREARKDEARLWLGMTCNEEADTRIAELEVGND